MRKSSQFFAFASLHVTSAMAHARGYRPDRRKIPSLHREMQLQNRRTGWIDIYYRMGEGKYRFGRSVPGPDFAARENARTSFRQCDA